MRIVFGSSPSKHQFHQKEKTVFPIQFAASFGQHRFLSPLYAVMSAKTKAKKGPQGGDSVKQEDVVQAVVIADSFNVRFAPITSSLPRALLPLVNQPLIDYTLESLAMAGVQEVFVYCVTHANQIRNHLNQSKWSKGNPSMILHVISSEDCRSMGDALRDIEGKSLIRGDFILLSADVVSNVQLTPILEKHKEQRKHDKGLAMTNIYRPAEPGHFTRTPEDECVLAVNRQTGRILHCQNLVGCRKSTFPLEIFQENAQVEIRMDLAFTHICICSPIVLPLFSDNFDYQTHSDFVKGILINEEVMGNTIYYHELSREYAARVSDIHMYDAVSRDVISRRTHPFVPDLSMRTASARFKYSRHNIYQQPVVTLANKSVLEKNVLVGGETSIGENTFITCSVIGKKCTIGSNVRITNAYIWDGATIEANCVVDTALVGHGVVVRESSKIHRGCVLDSGVEIGAHSIIPEMTRLVAFSRNGEPVGRSPITEGSNAYVYEAQREEDDSDEESVTHDMWGKNGDGEESEDEDNDSRLGSDSESDMDDVASVPDDEGIFYHEVLDSLQRGYEEKIKCENLVLEINSSKYAYNVTMKEVNMYVTKAILELGTGANNGEDNPASFGLVKPVLVNFLPLLRNYIKSQESQLDCLRALEGFAGTNANFVGCLAKVLHILYEKDIVSEEALLEWYNGPHEDPANLRVRKQVHPFIQWLQEAEEESESDD